MTIDLTDTTTGAIARGADRRRGRRLGGPTLGHGAHADHRHRRGGAVRRHPGGQPGGPGAPVPGPRRHHPQAQGRLPARRRDPGGRDRPRRDDRAAHVRPARPARRLGGRAAAAAGRARGHLVARRGARRRPPPTRSARWPSAGSPTRRPATRRTEMLLALADGYQPGDTDLAGPGPTPWRSLLAATLDQPYPRAAQPARSPAEQDNPTADLIAAWLSLRLGIPVQRGDSGGPGHHRGRVHHAGRRHHDLARRRPHGHPDLAGPDRPPGGAAAPGHRRADRGGTAQARPGRGLRGDAGRSTCRHRPSCRPCDEVTVGDGE